MISHIENAHRNKQISVSFRKEIIFSLGKIKPIQTSVDNFTPHLVASISIVYLQAEVCMP